ncbi:toprim domain-containing protein [Larsenimonas rhizosphaerae]|uniref:toprim domain-containing protein n=1 Tax=Larsenimonas rhizosphaerae TaxID=2944682 RepID=UPI002033A9B9|nr:toprim domain-containing protein [Larsenimonas rhizosphaerae]MCM2131965.1 toprim domain-containing protein [Larsenimonas rhizosphaerae]
MSDALQRLRLVSRAALSDAETLLAEWLPDGQRQGTEWVARNALRGDRRSGSFGVSLSTGKWNDFADSEAHGGDLVSLYSYLHGCRQGDAARAIDARLGLGIYRASELYPLVAEIDTRAPTGSAETGQAQRDANRAAAAERARKYWSTGRNARTNPYVQQKEIPPTGVRQSHKGWLMVPLFVAGELVNLQWIQPNGKKRFLKGGQVQGAYCLLGTLEPGKRLYVCEGWATGATLHYLTGDCVACALHAGNLLPVARHFRKHLNGSLDLVIAGDDDRQTEGNPGRRLANEAAIDVGALVLFPSWRDGCPEHLTDFNDLYRWHNARMDAEERAQGGPRHDG